MARGQLAYEAGLLKLINKTISVEILRLGASGSRVLICEPQL